MLFYRKSEQNVPVVVDLMVAAKLVSHDDGTLCLLCATARQVFLVERCALKVFDAALELRVTQDLLDLLTWRAFSHYEHIQLLLSVVLVKALREE